MSGIWPSVKLREVLSRRPPDVRVELDREYQFAGVYSFARGVFRGHRKLGSGFSYRELTTLQPGDFIYPKLMAWEGAFGVVPSTCSGCVVSPEFPVFVPLVEQIEPRFLAYYFQQPHVWESISGKSTGTNVRRRRLNPSDFLAYAFPLPPLSEQRRLVTRLDALNATIDEASTLRQQAAAATEAFILSVHSKLAGNRERPLKDMLTLDEETIAILPAGSYPQVGVKSFGRGLFPKGAVRGTETSYKTFNRLYSGALLLSQVKGWEGAVSVCPQELEGWFVSPEYRTFRCIPTEVRPGYLAHLVRTEWFWRHLRDATRGVGARRERTRPEQFLRIMIPMPDVEQQERGEMIFRQIDVLKQLQGETGIELDSLTGAILDRAFKGKL